METESEFKYMFDNLNQNNPNLVLVEIAHQLKRIADSMENKK